MAWQADRPSNVLACRVQYAVAWASVQARHGVRCLGHSSWGCCANLCVLTDLQHSVLHHGQQWSYHPHACPPCPPQANKELAEPLQKAQAELAELQSQLADYQKDKQSLAATKSRLGGAEKQVRGGGVARADYLAGRCARSRVACAASRCSGPIVLLQAAQRAHTDQLAAGPAPG